MTAPVERDPWRPWLDLTQFAIGMLLVFVGVTRGDPLTGAAGGVLACLPGWRWQAEHGWWRR